MVFHIKLPKQILNNKSQVKQGKYFDFKYCYFSKYRRKFVDAAYFADILTEDTYPNGQEEIVRTKLAQYIKLHPEVEGIYIGTQTESL